MRRYGAYTNPIGGMVCAVADDRLILRDILQSLPAAKILAWRARIRGAWLCKVGETMVTTEKEVVIALTVLSVNGAAHCDLVFLHP